MVKIGIFCVKCQKIEKKEDKIVKNDVHKNWVVI